MTFSENFIFEGSVTYKCLQMTPNMTKKLIKQIIVKLFVKKGLNELSIN